MPETGILTPRLAQAMNDLEAALRDFGHALQETKPADAAPPTGPVFSALRQWRTEQARAKGLPPYIIASDAVLKAIDAARPTDLAQLQLIRGVGPSKAATYGTQILEVVARSA